MDGLDWTGLDPTQKASPIRASSDANNSLCTMTKFRKCTKKLFIKKESTKTKTIQSITPVRLEQGTMYNFCIPNVPKNATKKKVPILIKRYQ